MGLKQELKEACELLLRECLGHVGHVSLDLVQFGLEIESDLDTWFKLFSKFSDYKYVPYDIRKKKERHHVTQQQFSVHRHP